MSWLEVLVKMAGGAASPLDALLRQAGNIAPELKPTADYWLERLGQAVSSDNVGTFYAALPAEGKDILRGIIKAEDHPSDAI